MDSLAAISTLESFFFLPSDSLEDLLFHAGCVETERRFLPIEGLWVRSERFVV